MSNKKKLISAILIIILLFQMLIPVAMASNENNDRDKELIDENNNIVFEDEKLKNALIENGFDTNEDKVAILNTTEIPMISRIQNYLHTENLGQFLLSVLRNSIRIEECNGKECYKIEGYFDNLLISGDNAKTTIYLEKSTGLPVRVLTGTEKTEEGEVSTFTDYWYEFDQVTASDLKEPDIYLYRVEE